MMSLRLALLMLVASLALAAPRALAAEAGGLAVDSLTCEHLTDPLGLDVLHPRLAWVLHATDPAGRGERQTAYQVLVATRADLLRPGRADLWDTGKVASDQSIELPYGGKALASSERCYWAVRVWDRYGRASDFSKPAMWSMGLPRPSDWHARWITYTPPAAPATGAKAGRVLSFDRCQWIWYPEGDPHTEAPAGKRLFRRVFELPAGAKVAWAGLLVVADDQYVAYVDGKEVGHSDGEGYAWQRPQKYDLTARLRPGRNVVAVEATNSAASPAGLIAKLVVQRVGGAAPVTVVTNESWKTAKAGAEEKAAGGSAWRAVGFDDAGWVAAKQLGPMGTAPWMAVQPEGGAPWGQKAPSPIFRKAFEVRRPVRRATVSICGLGYYVLYINGHRVGNHVLDPTFTRYDRRCLYVTYDVTRLVRRGANAVGVMLGNGFFNQHARDAWDFQRAPWRARPRMIFELRLVGADGSVRTVGSDATWRASTGPVVRDGIRNGEVYDARLERPGWDEPGFDDSGWARATLAAAPKGTLRAEMMPPIRVTRTIRPVKLTEPKPGVYVFDMGQEFAGWARLRVRGPAGTKVTMKYGERLNPDGTINRDAIRTLVYQGPFQTDTYILSGHGEEVYEAAFAYYGFRWVQVEGFPGKPTLDSLVGCVVHTDFAPAGLFECSNPLINAIQRLTLWSYRSNFVGIPTDCPHREKNGWTGDAQLACEQALFNFRNTAAYEQWMDDFDDCQRPAGDLPGIVPTGGWGYGTGPAWDSAYLLIPWYLYEYQGDRRVLAEHYAGMKRYVDYLTGRQKDYIVDYGLSDWCPAKVNTPAAVTSTGYYYVDALIVARAAALLGKRADAAKYGALAGRIREAFNRHFYHGDGAYDPGMQTALACALYQGLAPEAARPEVVARLVAALKAADWHLTGGILGSKYVFSALADGGRADVAYRVATQTTAPSYGNWVKRGATTLWEDWYGNASLDHIMFGDISAWFYKYLAGIEPETGAKASEDAVGFRRFVVHPRVVGDLTWVRAEHRSPYGLIQSAWRIAGGRLRMDVTVPVGCHATVWVPGGEAGAVTEGGEGGKGGPAAKQAGVTLVRKADGCAVYEVTSGRYRFSVAWAGRKE